MDPHCAVNGCREEQSSPSPSVQKVVVLVRQGRHKNWEGKWGFQRKENDEWELGKSEETYKKFCGQCYGDG